MTITAPTKGELAAQVAQLRYELDALRDELSEMYSEVRTHRLVIDDHEGKELAVVDGDHILTRRLVVVDEAGDEWIGTTVRDNSTSTRIEHGDATDPTYATVSLYAGAGASDGELAEALVVASTGDDHYSILVQRDYDDRTRSGVAFIAGPDHSLEHHIERPGGTP